MMLHIDQHAVHAVANANVFFQWFNVNVGSLLLESLHQQICHQLDDWSVVISHAAVRIFGFNSAHHSFIAIDVGLKCFNQRRSGAVILNVRLQHMR